MQFQSKPGAAMLCDHCGDCYELLTDVRVLNRLSNEGSGRSRFNVVVEGVPNGGYDGPYLLLVRYNALPIASPISRRERRFVE